MSTATTQTPADLARDAATVLRRAMASIHDHEAFRELLREGRNIASELSEAVDRAAFNARHRLIAKRVSESLHDAAISDRHHRTLALSYAILCLDKMAAPERSA